MDSTADASSVHSIPAHDDRPGQAVDRARATTIIGRSVIGRSATDKNAERSLPRGQSVGRYVVLDRIGAGGMGVVYAGYDPELDRRVAIKLLRDRPSNPASAKRRQRRLLREAQALARLDHPNVVSVHDVGEHEGGVYVAMEFIDGMTLGDWLPGKEGRWREVLEVFLRAGRGLVAAHAKGLVHRDFKPDNVMLGHDDRVRVMDFGLARPTGDTTLSSQDDETDDDVARPSIEALQTPLTQAGMLMGTPAFMAPEQHLREEVGAAADQFAFCAALWFGIYGRYPYEGKTVLQIGARAINNELSEPPSLAVPRWLRDALTRGLRSRSDERFESMSALLEVLQAGLQRQRRRPMVLAGLAVGALGLGAMGLVHHGHAQQAAACVAAGEQIDDTWSPETRDRIEHAVRGTERVYAAEAVDHALPLIDDWVHQWRSQRQGVCTAAQNDHGLEPELEARATACFAERRLQLEAMVSTVQEDPEAAVEGLVKAASRLPQVDQCADPRYLQQRPTRSEDSTEAVHRIWILLSESRSLHHTGNLEPARRRAQRALEAAEGLGDTVLTAEARVALGTVLMKQGDYDGAQASLAQAFVDAGSVDAIEAAAMASSALVYLVGYVQDRHDEGLAWAKVAEVYTRRIEVEPGLWSAVFHNQIAAVHLARADYDEARAAFERSLALRERILGNAHPAVADSLGNIAAVVDAGGDPRKAVEIQQRAVLRKQTAYGLHHPSVAVSMTNLGDFHRKAGQLDEAKGQLERALETHRQIHGTDHPQTMAALNNLALVHKELGDYDAAEPLHRRVLEVRREAFGPEHPSVAFATLNLALLHRARGDLEAALPLEEHGVALLERSLGPEHPKTVRARYNLGNALALLGLNERATAVHEQVLALRKASSGTEDFEMGASLSSLGNLASEREQTERAAKLYAEALAFYERSPRHDDPSVATPLLGLARIHLERDEAGQALALAERALVLSEGDRESPTRTGRARFVLARALWEADAPAGRARAASLARGARTALDHARTSQEREAIDAWLAARALGPPIDGTSDSPDEG